MYQSDLELLIILNLAIVAADDVPTSKTQGGDARSVAAKMRCL